MQTVTLTLDLPDELANRFHALPADTRKHYALVLSDLIAAEATDDEPLDMAFVAKLIAADKEAARTGNDGSISLEDMEAQMNAPGFLERARAQFAAEGVTAAQVIGAPEPPHKHRYGK